MGKPGIGNHLFIKSIYYLFIVVVVIGVLYSFKMLFAPVVASILIAILIDPLADYFEEKGLSRFTTVVCLYIVIAVGAVFAAYFLVPRLISEVENLSAKFPAMKQEMKTAVANLQGILEEKFPDRDIPELWSVIVEHGPGKMGGIDIDAVINSLSSFFALLSVVVIIPIMSFFIVTDGQLIQKFILQMVPNRYFELVVLLIHRIVSAVKSFVQGQLIDAIGVGVLTTIGMACIQMPYFIVIGIIAGLGNLIPYLGPVIGFLPALFVVVMGPEGFDVGRILLVIGVFGLVQFIEGTFIYPIAVGKSVNLHPLVVILGITIGGQVGGVLGMIIAIPLISITKVSLGIIHEYLHNYSII